MNFEFEPILRRVLRIGVFLLLFQFGLIAQTLPDPTVVLIERPSIVDEFSVDARAVNEMLETGLRTLTNQPTTRDAWTKGLGISPSDIVGIKITTAGGTLLSTHHALVDAICNSLIQAGLPASHLIIWDKSQDEMTSADWAPSASGDKIRITSVIPDTGFDPDKFYVNENLGKLIWGDYQFVGKKPTAADLLRVTQQFATPEEGENSDEFNQEARSNREAIQEQTSNKSFYAKLLTQLCTKIINVPVLSDNAAVGLNGCLSTLALGSVDNTRRFDGEEVHGDPAIPEILDKDFIRKKVVLHLLDALVVQYAGGPKLMPHYTQSVGALYFSHDPVAIDSLVLPRLEAWRAAATVVPLGSLASHVKTAATYRLGENDPKKIKLVKVP